MYEIIKAVSAAVSICLSLYVGSAYLHRKQYQEAWWFLALTALITFITQP